MAVEQAGVGGALAAATTSLSRSMSTAEIAVLAKGQVKRGLVATIPEGWRTEQSPIDSRLRVSTRARVPVGGQDTGLVPRSSAGRSDASD